MLSNQAKGGGLPTCTAIMILGVPMPMRHTVDFAVSLLSEVEMPNLRRALCLFLCIGPPGLQAFSAPCALRRFLALNNEAPLHLSGNLWRRTRLRTGIRTPFACVRNRWFPKPKAARTCSAQLTCWSSNLAKPAEECKCHAVWDLWPFLRLQRRRRRSRKRPHARSSRGCQKSKCA